VWRGFGTKRKAKILGCWTFGALNLYDCKYETPNDKNSGGCGFIYMKAGTASIYAGMQSSQR